MAEMKTLTLGGKTYEIVDAKARSWIGDIAKLETAAPDLVSAINAAAKTGSGGAVDAADVQRIVEEYLAAHPPEKGDPGKPGDPGKDGVSPVVTVEVIEGGYRITITDAEGTKTADVLHGKDGDPGDPGEAATFEITGATALEYGETPTIIEQSGSTAQARKYALGIPAGKPGEPGTPGKTPVRGEDYWTTEDVEQIAQEAAKLVEPAPVEIDRLDAEKVFFPTDLITTTAIGNIKLTNGQATIPAAGKNLKQVWDTIFVQEKNPSTSQPSVSLTVSQAKEYEVGTKVTPSWSAKLNAGSYSYGPATGVTAKTWEISDTDGNKASTASGSFPELTIEDNTSYKITAKASYEAGAIPLTNTGNEYAAGQIKAGSKSATSGAITGYRNSFFGTLAEKAEITSDIIRGLTGKSGTALFNGNSFTVSVPVGAMRVVIAYPATLRDVSSIKDVNGMNAEISSGFALQTVRVAGANGFQAIDYKVYTMDFASANDTANTFTVTI